MFLVTALLGVLIRVGRSILGRPDGVPGGDAIRTGSFDTWPAVPNAPGPHRTGG
jgi:hypothetical protein